MNDFIDLVRRMRVAQKTYFRMRTSENLTAAKHLEKNVDDYIATRISSSQLKLW